MSRATKKPKNSNESGGVDPFDAAVLARGAAIEDAKDEKYVGNLLSTDTDGDHVAIAAFVSITNKRTAGIPVRHTGWTQATQVLHHQCI